MSPLPPSSSLEPVNDRAGEFALTPPTFITLPIISVHNKHLGRGVATSLTPISLKPQSRSDVPPITVNPAAPGEPPVGPSHSVICALNYLAHKQEAATG